MKQFDVAILGAGASGLMCAAQIRKNISTIIIERNEKAAKKLKISGGGKCNITNVAVNKENFDGDESFVSHALAEFSKDDLLEYFHSRGVEFEVRKKRYYFCKKSSNDVIDILNANTSHCKKVFNTKILEVSKTQELFCIKTSKGNFFAKNVVVATGGKSYAALGASDIGLEIAKAFGLDVLEFSPALVGLTVQKDQFWMKALSGLSCFVHIHVGHKLLHEEMLFTHKGISGPAVLSASLHWKRGNISIDFLPLKSIDELLKGSKKYLSSVIPLPKRLSKAILDALEIEDIECKKLSATTKEKLQQIHSYEFAPAGNFGFSKAEVSKGGVKTENLERETLQAKDVQGLYFVGEVVDVTGELGGYNFQWAFSSAHVCANALNRAIS